MMDRKVHPLYYEGKKQRFARSVVSGGFVFLSGSSGRTIETGEVSSNDVTEQTKVALDKIKLALAEAGSSLEHIVKMTIYLRDMRDYQSMKDAEFQYYQKHAPSLAEDPPASTVVQVVSLSKPNMLVEFDAIAVLPDT
jgi:2-iminobutanoate/2-iminopropanoate deaminase